MLQTQKLTKFFLEMFTKLEKTTGPHMTVFTILAKLSSMITISEARFATSVPKTKAKGLGGELTMET